MSVVLETGWLRSGWLQIAEGDLELMNLPLPPGAGVSRIPPPCRFYVVLGVKPRPLCHWASTLLSWAALLPPFDFIPFVDQETWMQIVVFFLPKLLSGFTPTKMFWFLLLQRL